MNNKFLALLLDVILVIAFVAIGRRSHSEDLAGTLLTAVPFLVALGVSWVTPWVHKVPFALFPAGITSWLVTVILGQCLRVMFGGTSAISFVIVTTTVLAVFLLGWRFIYWIIMRKKSKRAEVI